jgi:hypothetical protein
MSLKPLSERQKTLIVNNLVKACKDIEQLNSTGYKFIYLASGFIAHYDLNGFKSAYEYGVNLKNAILNNQRFNQWSNFREGERDYDYYMSKKDVYNRVCAKLLKA